MIVFFVGLHFKHGFTALDSRTLSGKRIDMIIERLPKDVEAVKTNLHDSFEMPPKHLIGASYISWNFANNPSKDDVIFLLGGKVLKDFNLRHKGIVSIFHPAKVMSKAGLEKYVSDAVSIVESFTNNNQ